MKRTTSIIIAILISISLLAQESKGIIFESGTLSEALQKAKKNKKSRNLVFLDCYTTWCGPCKYMANNVFTIERVGNFFNDNFVNVKIDMEKGEGIELAKKYQIKAYPTFLILDSDGNEINRIVGGGEADQFIEKVKGALDINSTPKKKREVYDSNKTFENALTYINALNDSYLSEELNSFIVTLFPTLKIKERYSEKLWPFLSQVLSLPNCKLLDIVIADKYYADQYLSKKQLDEVICSSVKSQIAQYVSGKTENNDTIAIKKNINVLLLLANNDQTINYYVKIYDLYSQNKFEQISKLFDANSIMRMSYYDRVNLERLYINTKNLPKEAISKYFQNKASYLKSQYEQATATADKYMK